MYIVRSIPKHNVLVIGGDMNAQIGKNGMNSTSQLSRVPASGDRVPVEREMW